MSEMRIFWFNISLNTFYFEQTTSQHFVAIATRDFSRQTISLTHFPENEFAIQNFKEGLRDTYTINLEKCQNANPHRFKYPG